MEPGKWRLAPNAPAPLASLLPGGELNPDVPEFVPHFLQHAAPAEAAPGAADAAPTAEPAGTETAGEARPEEARLDTGACGDGRQTRRRGGGGDMRGLVASLGQVMRQVT